MEMDNMGENADDGVKMLTNADEALHPLPDNALSGSGHYFYLGKNGSRMHPLPDNAIIRKWIC